MQVGAGFETDGFLSNGFVVILDERGVGPCLIGGMTRVSFAAT